MNTTVFLTVVSIGFSVLAGTGSRVLLKDSKTFETTVSTETVRCSDIGYGAELLKINLAGLDGWTLFDHSNNQFGEFGEPCMSAGACKSVMAPNGFTVESLVQNNPGSEVIKVEREVIEKKHIGQSNPLFVENSQDDKEVCIRQLVENLKTTVRGIEFQHSRTGAVEKFPREACASK